MMTEMPTQSERHVLSALAPETLRASRVPELEIGFESTCGASRAAALL